MDFYLSINNRERVILLPVNPPELTVGSPQGNETYSTVNGELNLIGNIGLKTISFSSFFPMDERNYSKNNSLLGFDYIDTIEDLRSRKLPFRFIVTDTNINLPVTIDEFEWSVLKGRKINYSLNLREFRF